MKCVELLQRDCDREDVKADGVGPGEGCPLPNQLRCLGEHRKLP